VPPESRDAVAALVAGRTPAEAEAALAAELPRLVGRPEQHCFTGVFRWTERPADLGQGAGAWEPSDGPNLPDWLRPFPGEVLVARDEDSGEYLAGVGLKPHDPTGIEISVGTAEAARGRGLARALVARAARDIVAQGAVPIYLHDPANLASARVADAAGFADLHWKVHAIAGNG
jgi:RimJ/RimL family protein N-acetyltransferase